MTSASQRRMGRRDFVSLTVKGAGAVGFAIVGGKFLVERLGGIPSDVRAQTADPHAWVMVIDLDRCDGCGVCTTACRNTHNVPDGQEWIKVYEVNEPEGAHYFLPRPCMHCDNAPCVAVCPVGATFRREDGLVLIDQNRCIGCRYCMAACPYSARYFNWDGPLELTPEEQAVYSPEYPGVHRRGTVEKCVFCAHRVDEGSLPACVEACPMRAIFFGDAREDAVSNGSEVWRLSEVLRDRGGFRFKEELGTKPRVFYLPPEADG